MRTLSLAILWVYAHAIAESVSIIHSYSFEGSPEPGFRIRAKEARTFFFDNCTPISGLSGSKMQSSCFVRIRCNNCGGSGWVSCYSCGGTGMRYSDDPSSGRIFADLDSILGNRCLVCNGTGILECHSCHGKGMIDDK